LNGSAPQTEPKKRSRRLYLVLTAALLLIIIILIADFLGQTSYGPGPVDIEVTPDKQIYLQGEEVNFAVYVNNPQDWPVPYPNGEGYAIEKDGLYIDGYGGHIDYPAGGIPTFPANSRTLTKWQWDQKMLLNGTRVQVQPGNYTLTFSISGYGYSESSNCTFEIR
jgi:hypothetical protein